jgi:3-hydroxybutyryl-CoA dehydrogenase
MSTDHIQCVLVVGAGTMGQQIAVQCARHGLEVAVYDVKPEALDRARAQIAAYARELEAEGRLSAAEAAALLARVRLTTDAREAGRDAQLLSESVPEDPQLKRRVLAEFHAICPPDAIFTTNSSTLLPSTLAAATGRPAQFMALHFHTPVWVSNVADVMPHPGTAPATVATVTAFARRIGQIPIVLERENEGYVLNAMLTSLNHAALTLAANGVTSVENIDRAWMGVTHMPLGPFGVLDLVGLDTAHDITQLSARRRWYLPQLRKNARFLAGYVKRGHLGRKTGRGFYTYPDPAFEQPGFVR